jgi:2-C-methyl-D-erythritol 4-phosphate cytidylyltransferase/2-C-methyl-D-erythritol 2,4-cyclodiphosphate synthase
VRIGQGVDIHRFSEDRSRQLWLGLVHVPGELGLEGHSDADAAAHALCDALLGAAGLGDLGRHFSDRDPENKGVASRVLLTTTVEMVAEAGYRVESADVTIVAERPRLADLMGEMSSALGDVIGAPVSVKATTAEGLGAIGAGEGVAAFAVALLSESR